MQALLSTSSTQYRTRVSYVDALLWDGGNIDAIQKLLNMRGFDWDKRSGLSVLVADKGMQKVPVGYWVVVDATGSRSILDPDSFDSKYAKS